MDMVHGELSLADQFARLKLPQSAAHKILSAPPPAESNSFRIDFRSSHVHYLNNLEEDGMYRRWRSNIQEVLLTSHFLGPIKLRLSFCFLHCFASLPRK